MSALQKDVLSWTKRKICLINSKLGNKWFVIYTLKSEIDLLAWKSKEENII